VKGVREVGEVKVTKDLQNKKLVIEYVASGRIEKVWQAYTDKDLFEKWWGPEGWDTIAKEFSFHPGGRIHYGMKCVDPHQHDWFGRYSWGIMEIEDVEEMKSFTCRDYFSDEEGNKNLSFPTLKITNEFVEEDGKTRIISTSYADTEDQIEELIKMGALEGFSSQLAKLEKLVRG
jgi:uncharacterized protein YndB with AHSA1/START domain